MNFFGGPILFPQRRGDVCTLSCPNRIPQRHSNPTTRRLKPHIDSPLQVPLDPTTNSTQRRHTGPQHLVPKHTEPHKHEIPNAKSHTQTQPHIRPTNTHHPKCRSLTGTDSIRYTETHPPHRNTRFLRFKTSQVDLPITDAQPHWHLTTQTKQPHIQS